MPGVVLAHCRRFPDEFPGSRVDDLPGLRDSLVLVSNELPSWTRVYECSLCEQPWEETYEQGGHGDIPIVRKFGAITPDGLRATVAPVSSRGVPAVAFFKSVISEVLTPVMASRGFVSADWHPSFLHYRRGRTWVSFAYEGWDEPVRYLSILLALEDSGGRTMSVGLWRDLPEDVDDAEYWNSGFSSERELREVLDRVVRELMPHATALWDSDERLAALIAERRVEVEHEYLQNADESELINARRVFREGRYSEACEVYDRIGPDQLSAADRRRFYIARQQLGQPETASGS